MSYIIPENELYHYGIKGQKWGIRRFQNVDGSYTQAGLKRYNRLQSEYNYLKSKREQSYRNGDKEKYYEYHLQAKRKKKEMNKAYRNLSKYKKIDQGADLYAQGKRIGTNYTKQAIAAGVGYVGSRLADSLITDRNAKAVVRYGLMTTSLILDGKYAYENDRLRRYYGRDVSVRELKKS